MLSAIRAKGMTDAEIGQKLGNTPQATVFRLRTGKHTSTNYERYAQIEALYKRTQRQRAA